MNRRSVQRLLTTGAIGAASVLLIAADAPTGGEPGTYGFVISNLFMANPGDADSCPIIADGDLDRYFKMLSPAEQAEFSSPDKRQALEAKMTKHFGFRRLSLRGQSAAAVKLPPGVDLKTPINEAQALEIGRLNGFPKGRGRPAFQNTTVAYSACSDPADFAELGEGFKIFEGKSAAGIDLDGKAGAEDFQGVDGKPGVDNQLWRAVGCVKAFRESSDAKLARKTFMSARAPTLIELKGVDSLQDDPDVIVNVYAAAEPLARDARGDALARASFAVEKNPRLRATVRGRIKGGVLETDPVDLVLNYKEQIIDAPRDIRGARIRATFGADGSIQGSLFGYYTVASYYSSIEQMTQNGANLTGVSCPGVYQAVNRLADGYRDAKTGRYTAISSAYNFVGVRAFVIADAAAREAVP